MLANENPAPVGDRAGLDVDVIAVALNRYPVTANADPVQVVDLTDAAFDRPDLVGEALSRSKALSAEQLAWLEGQGVSRSAIIGGGRNAFRGGIAMLPNTLMAAEICLIAPGSWEFPDAVVDESVKPSTALIWFGLDVSSNAVDVIAWLPRTGAIATLTGASDISDEGVLSQRLEGEAQRVFFDPLQWLRAGRDGALVVDEHRRGGILRWCDTLSVSSVADGRRLRDRLKIREPKIVVAKVS
jgi:hypothetical protein